jgi:CheY-like chemotaxis protein
MKKVIVVDDDPTNMGLLQMLLELDGFSVVACATITEALTATEENTAAFVVDCHLSRGESGLELLDMIRQEETAAAKDCVVIVTSGDQRLKEESESRGANLFLLKPYPPSDLSISLAKLLEEAVDE